LATPNMGLTKPTENKSSGVWDTLLNDLIDIIDAHDHTSGKGVSVPSAALDIDAAVAWGGYNITNMGELGFATTTTGTVAKGLRVVSNELYWRTNGGVDVKLTNGNSLNLALVGGITGDYSSTDADCEYDDATKAYEMKQDESPDHFAKVKCADLHLYEEASGITNFVTVKSPGSLAASYTWTMPAALPAGNSLVQVDAAGAVTSDTSLPDFDVGTITVNTDMVLPEFVKTIHAAGGAGVNAAVGATGEVTASGASSWFLPISLNIGDRLKSVRVNYDRQAVLVTMAVVRSTSGASTTVETHSDSASTGYQYYDLDVNPDHTILADSHYFLNFTSAGANPILQGVQVTWDRP